MIAEIFSALELAAALATETSLLFHGVLLLLRLKVPAVAVRFYSDQPLRVAPVLQLRVCHYVFPIAES